MLCHVMHTTTPDYRSSAYTVEAVDQRAEALFQLGDTSAGIAKTVSKVAKLGPDCVEFGLGRWGRGPVDHEGAPSLTNDDATLPFELSNRGLGGVQSHSVGRHKRPVRGQSSTDRETPGIDVSPKAVRHAAARPSPPFGGQVVIHARRAYGTCRATAPTGVGRLQLC